MNAQEQQALAAAKADCLCGRYEFCPDCEPGLFGEVQPTITSSESRSPQASEPEKSLHELLRMGAEENEQLKAQLAGMEKLLRFKEAMDASGTSKDARTWCEYVAGMVGTYLNEPVDSDKCKAIAGIIERRLWALPAAPEATK